MTSPFAHILTPKPKDLGDGFVVRRALPAIERRAVGPFIFLDEMGPVAFAAGQGLDVRPHPHIGLATVTYLFEGAIAHKDSLGTEQVIRPGDVNWMTAGRGIVHSERSPQPRLPMRLHGIQFWVALPQAFEDAPPAFHHVPAAALPRWESEGARLTLIVGEAFGARAPLETFAPMAYLDVALSAGAAVETPFAHPEMALYVVEGAVRVGEARVEKGQLGVFAEAPVARLEAADGATARAILFGGAPLDGPRKLWWNFVSSDPARIEAAKQAWAEQTMGLVPGETETIPLPPY